MALGAGFPVCPGAPWVKPTLWEWSEEEEEDEEGSWFAQLHYGATPTHIVGIARGGGGEGGGGRGEGEGGRGFPVCPGAIWGRLTLQA